MGEIDMFINIIKTNCNNCGADIENLVLNIVEGSKYLANNIEGLDFICQKCKLTKTSKEGI